MACSKKGKGPMPLNLSRYSLQYYSFRIPDQEKVFEVIERTHGSLDNSAITRHNLQMIHGTRTHS